MNIRVERASEYVLKVCGQDEFLVGEYELIQFQYIQDCFSRDITPTVVTLHVNKVPGRFVLQRYGIKGGFLWIL